MIPDAAEVVRRRWTAMTILRLLSIVALLSSLLPAGSWISEGLRDDDLFDVSYYWPRMLGAVGGLVLGAIMLLLAAPLARWAVPFKRELRCPRCDYRLEGLVDPLCSECGLVLTREFLGEPRELAPETDAQRIIRLQDTVATVVRLLGLLMVVGFGASATLHTITFFVEPFYDAWWVFMLSTRILTQGTLVIVGMVFMVKGGLIGRLLAPRARG
ncbi:MAG: hypothetical protein DHS20C14_11480 [Phycisphaeraceae bacterium]|nr:MAG: hypothetical protein DHS20C14_11480 [Phycisphaeraceae bacterium]